MSCASCQLAQLTNLVSAALRQKSSVYESALENAVEDKFGDIVNLRASTFGQKSVLYRSKDTATMRFYYDRDDDWHWDFLFPDAARLAVPYPRERNGCPMVFAVDDCGSDFEYGLEVMSSPDGHYIGSIHFWVYQETDDVMKFLRRRFPYMGFSFLDARDGIDFCRALKSYEFATRFRAEANKSVVHRLETRKINVDFCRAFHRDEIRSSLQKAENGDALYPAYELYEPFVLNEKSIKFTSADVDAADAEFLDDEVEVGNLVVDASGGTVEGRKIVSLHMVLPARVL